MTIEKIWWQDAYATVDKVRPGDPAGLTLTIGCASKEDDTFIYVSNYFDGISSKWTSPWVAIPKGIIAKREVLDGGEV